MPKAAANGKLSRRFTCRLSEANMNKLHRYALRLSQDRNTRVSYSQALALLIESIPKKSLVAASRR